ncbi:DNA-binding transcriptional LysR family regulator [Devosia subaequoris]|uniref:DNA-binding transcriptional LysR family regulator n=1 Tax=Devosia subaequoris TaxID=395930 RepID=A0A7W6NCG4_9HYPH|nr:LysR family transcriptional regulator [Devosia subaequoris]MBB4052903.1 DNA-binding transcriptional LysR family regulator [Devosia subaequoris]MCP1210322.1 LysR family transcriptional regulator [Devosia subaequoris]
MAPFDSVTARLILLLAETGSIGRAAEREGIASSAVSRRVSDLEGRLGVVLFDRSAHGVKLTKAGEAYAGGCRTVLRSIADLDAIMDDFSSGQRGSLRLACTSSALTGRLPELLAKFAGKYPGIEIAISEMGAAKALLSLDEGQADIAIVSDNYDFSRFEIRPFEDERVWVLVPPEHELAASMEPRKSVSFDTVVPHSIVGIHHAGSLDRLLSEAAKKLGHPLNEALRVESFPALVRMVEAGFGIGFLRSTSLHLLAGTDLVCAPLSEPWAMRKLLVARRKSSPLSAAMKSFVSLAAETYLPSV